MTLNAAYVGKVYPTTPAYLVGREKIREFAAAIGDDNPAFHDLDAARALGLPDLMAPPTFPFVITMRAMTAAMFDPEIGLDYGRVVHGEQSFEYARPLVAGDEVVVEASIESIDSTGRNERMTVLAVVRTVEGEQVVTTRSVLVSRGTGAGGTAARTPSGRAQDPPAEPGDPVATGSFPVERVDLIRYCGASGDFNPIHWNERVATAVGLPNVIAHGMLTMAQAGRLVTMRLGDPTRLEAFAVRFTAPVVVPDDDTGREVQVTLAGAELPADGGTGLDVTATVDGVTVLRGRAAAAGPVG
jgi:acyl dehydratase